MGQGKKEGVKEKGKKRKKRKEEHKRGQDMQDRGNNGKKGACARKKYMYRFII
jgi:hypothetical protein